MQLETLTGRIIEEAEQCRDRHRYRADTRVEVHVPRKVYRQYMKDHEQLAVLAHSHVRLLRPRSLWDRITYRSGSKSR